jgi:hypothetical protein
MVHPPLGSAAGYGLGSILARSAQAMKRKRYYNTARYPNLDRSASVDGEQPTLARIYDSPGFNEHRYRFKDGVAGQTD